MYFKVVNVKAVCVNFLYVKLSTRFFFSEHLVMHIQVCQALDYDRIVRIKKMDLDLKLLSIFLSQCSIEKINAIKKILSFSITLSP